MHPENHWTHRLFVENAELYLPFLEQARERAPREVGLVADLFAQCGVPEGGKLLDVACGIGRHSVPLAKLGYGVTGVDISPLYIQKAQEAACLEGAEADFLVGDMLDVGHLVEGRAPFDAIISMFTSHSYYGREGDLSMFRQLRSLASPDAVLVILTANQDWIVRNFSEESAEESGRMRILQHRNLDMEKGTIHNDWEFYEGHNDSLKLRLKLEMSHKLYSLHELTALLEESGWHYLRSLGAQEADGDEIGPVTLDSNAMWVVARA